MSKSISVSTRGLIRVIAFFCRDNRAIEILENAIVGFIMSK